MSPGRLGARGLALLGLILWSVPLAAQGQVFHDDFVVHRNEVLDRGPWVGPQYFANRLMDWRLGDRGLECIESSPAKPMRTVHLLTQELAEGSGEFSLELHAGAAWGPSGEGAEAWQGVLLGVGGDHVDWRTRALVHHWPGLDGGLLVAVDERGRVVVRDNEHAQGPRGPRRDFTAASWPLLAEGEPPPGDAPTTGWVLRIEGRVESGSSHLRAVASRDGTVLSWVELDLPAEALRGGVALVSHRKSSSFERWTLQGSLLRSHPERTFGPFVGALYTLSEGVLHLTVQMVPLGPGYGKNVSLQLQGKEVQQAPIEPGSWIARFRIEGWSAQEDVPYRLFHSQAYDRGSHIALVEDLEGVVRKPPAADETLVMAALSCQDISSAGRKHWNNDHFWWPHAELVEHVGAHDPDLLFFAGDQIYEGGLEGIVRRPTDRAIVDYLNHWYRFLWAFGDLTRSRPTICLPDDHDVYHGNIWGNGGVRAPAWEGIQYDSDRGGYMMSPEFVNVVHDTQVSHLPAPRDPEPLPNGISVYHTSLEYGGVSFGIVADRMWKSAPAPLLPGADVRNGWARAEDFDAAQDADAEGALLLGPRQLDFLEDWVAEWGEDTRMKVLLSQTIFNNVATLPPGANSGNALPGAAYPGPGEYPEGEQVAADFDSNAWPQSGRRRALEILRRGLAFHVAGDQHLASFVQYGLDDYGDGPFAFCVPAIANLWPRRFFPPTPGANRPEGAPPYAGDHRDGFGNPMTVHAVANPVRSGVPPTALNDRNPGYGIVRFDPAAGTITSECWPRWVDPRGTDPRQFEGWPRTVEIEDGYLGRSDRWLPKLRIEGVTDPLLTVIDRDREQVVYRVRARGPEHVLRVPGEGPYDVLVSDPDSGRSRRVPGLRPAPGGPEGEIRVNLADPTPGAPAD